MAISKGITEAKTKNFTFRITKSLADDMTSTKEMCKKSGISWNVTEALTQSLEAELKAVQKHIQKHVAKDWTPGQTCLDLDLKNAES